MRTGDITVAVLTARNVPSGEWWLGLVEEVPGANAPDKTLEEVRESLREAAELVLQANRQLCDEEIGSTSVREAIEVHVA